MNLRTKIENRLNDFLDDLEVLEDMSEVLLLKAKIECLRISADTLSKMKSGTESTAPDYNLPDF